MRGVMVVCAAVLLAAAAPALAQELKDKATIQKELGIGSAPAEMPAASDDGKIILNGHRGGGGPLSLGHQASRLDVQFMPGSSNLTSLGRAQLDILGEALKSDSHRFRIEGHTDTTGSAQANLVLSQRRAEAVVTYLVTQCGIDRGQLEAIGMGKQGLAIPTADQVAEPRNRRVAVVKL